MRLARLDPLSVNPSVIVVAATMPRPLRLRSGDVHMRIAIDSDDPQWAMDETFELEIVRSGEAGALKFDPASHEAQAARMAVADLERLARVQAKSRAYRALGLRDGKGSLSVSIAGGCREGDIGNGPLNAQLYMKTDGDGDYFPVTGIIDLRALAGESNLENIPPC